MVIYTARGKYRQEIEECARFLWDKLPFRPQWGIITGTGQTQLAKRLESPRGGVPYQELPHFPQPTGPGHEGWLHWGSLAGKPVLLFQGRIHAYEGYSLPEVTFPVRVMAALGVKQMLVTNAAGGLNPHFQAGDLMLISDHINLIGDNPLVGENIDDWGPRFPDMSRAYDRELLELAEEVGRQQGLGLRKGVYVAVKGPSLETPAETRFLRLIGADAVGMSTVPEVIVGVHAGFRIMGISVISNVNLPEAMAPIALEQIIATVAATEPRLLEFISGVLERT